MGLVQQLLLQQQARNSNSSVTMDFNSTVEGSKIYVLDKKSFNLSVGTLKSKTLPVAKLGTLQQTMTMTVDFDGKERVFTDVPPNADSAKEGDLVYACNGERLTPVIDSMVCQSRNVLDSIPFHERVVNESLSMKSMVNPKIAEDEKRLKAIEDLQKKQAATDEKLDTILKMLKDITVEKKSK